MSLGYKLCDVRHYEFKLIYLGKSGKDVTLGSGKL